MSTKVHKVFVSYHHENDDEYRDDFEDILKINGISVVKSVQMGDINPGLKTDTIRQKIRDEYLRDSTVTVVLVGKDTFKRKHVDWEIASSIRKSKTNLRSGLVGMLVPSHPACGKREYDPHTIPPRLYDNIECDFAELHDWTENPQEIQNFIHSAYERKDSVKPDHSRPLFGRNHTHDRWLD